MADIAATAKIIINADTAPAVHQLQKVVDANKKVADSAEKSGGSISNFIKSAVEGFGKFNLALGGVQQAFGLLNGAVDTAISASRREAMEKMLPAGSVDRFRDATDKLISRQDVLRVSVKGMSGDFKLTEGEMQKVLQASVALEQKGFGPAADIADKLVDALAKGVNKLDDFGINLEKTKDHQTDVNAAMSKFDALIRETPVDEQTASLTRLKDSLQEIAMAMSSVVAAAAKAIGWIAENWNEYAGDLFGAPELRAQLHRTGAAQAKLRGESFHADVVGAGLAGGAASSLDAYSASLMSDDRYYQEILGTPGIGSVGTGSADTRGGRAKPIRPARSGPTIAGGSRGGVIGGTGFAGDLGTGYGVGGAESFDFTGKGNIWDTGRQPGESYLKGQIDASTTGKAIEFMSQLTDQTTMLGGAWGVFQGAFGSAVAAAIDGSESIGKAFAKASAAGLKSLAVEYAVRALGEGAFAISSLAFGDGKGAATHGLAALKFAAAAAAAGVGSHVLGSLAGGGGGGGGASAGAAGGGYASPGARGGGGGGGDTIIVNLGDGFYGNRQETADAVARGVRQAGRQGSRQKFSASYSG